MLYTFLFLLDLKHLIPFRVQSLDLVIWGSMFTQPNTFDFTVEILLRFALERGYMSEYIIGHTELRQTGNKIIHLVPLYS